MCVVKQDIWGLRTFSTSCQKKNSLCEVFFVYLGETCLSFYDDTTKISFDESGRTVVNTHFQYTIVFCLKSRVSYCTCKFDILTAISTVLKGHQIVNRFTKFFCLVLFVYLSLFFFVFCFVFWRGNFCCCCCFRQKNVGFCFCILF